MGDVLELLMAYQPVDNSEREIKSIWMYNQETFQALRNIKKLFRPLQACEMHSKPKSKVWL